MTTINQFVNRHSIRGSSEWLDERTDKLMSDMPSGSSHWRVTLKHKRHQLTTQYSMGPAHSSEPDIRSVLSNLAMDASGFENASSFDDWCAEYGYDTDSRSAKRVFKAVERQSKQLRRFLGDSLYEDLLYNVESE